MFASPFHKGAKKKRSGRFDSTIQIADISFDTFDFGGNAMPIAFEVPAPLFPLQPGAESNVSSLQLEQAEGAPKQPGQPSQPAAPSQLEAQGQSKNYDDVPEKSSTSSGPGLVDSGNVGSARGRKAVDIARGEIGVKEEPKGSNRGSRVDQYQNGQGQPWCAHFVSWCVENSGGSPFGHNGWVEGLRRWAKSKSKYIPAGSAAPGAGDIFTMARTDSTGKLVGGHTGFVQSYDAKSNLVKTIEGNISDGVGERSRSVQSLDGFIRL